MKFKLFLILLLCVFTSVKAQVITGTIYDNTTSKPIPFASVGVMGSSNGTVTNAEGKFSLNIKAADSIVISHINYGLNTFKINQSDSSQVFKLEPVSVTLNEVLVTDKAVNEILYEAVRKSEEQLSSPIFLDTYYREFVKTNEKYTKFSDGLIAYQLEKKGNSKLKTTVWVKDSRAIELYDEKEEEFDWNLTSPLDVRDALRPSLISNVSRFMLEENKEYYEFDIKSIQIADGEQWNIITAYPKEDVEKYLSIGTIAIDAKTGLIMEVQYERSDVHKEYAKELNMMVMKMKTLDSKSKIVFSKSASTYNLSYFYRDISLRVWDKKNFDEEFRFTSDLLVTDILPDGKNLKKSDKYNKKSLYKRGKEYETEFWLNSNAIELTSEQQKIIDSLVQ